MGQKKAAIPEIRLVLPMKPQAFIGPKRCVFGRSGRTPSCPPEIAHCVTHENLEKDVLEEDKAFDHMAKIWLGQDAVVD